MYRIKGWTKFQHFKDRRPPWIKLYRDILEDPDWHELDGETAKILVSLWLIASEDLEGRLPDLRRLAFRLRIKESQINQALAKLSHWLDRDDIDLISDRHQDDAPETETETETEKEGETEREPKKRKPVGSRLDPESTLAPSWKTFCQTERKDLIPEMVWERFKDYWISQPGQKGVKVDWFATWRNWCRNEKKGNMRISDPSDKISEVKKMLGIQENGVIDA